MNDETLNQAWAGVCDQVKTYKDVDPSQVNAFFSRLHPQAMSEGFLILTADNDFIKAWIERHYTIHIKRALEEIYQTSFTLAIEVDARPMAPQEAQQPTREEERAAVEGNAPAEEPSPAGKRHVCEAPTTTFTFENFVIGDSNRMAYSMAVAVAETPGKAHLNPLFIYGKSGLGKTHLLRAIQNYVNETRPELRVVYADSAELLDSYMEASAAHDKEKQSYKNFKTHYEQADVLLIDDVEYLQGKKQTLDILFQIFNRLTTQGRQVVLSADRAPKNIDIDERYKSRFNSGGTFDIQPPEIETKLGIIRSFIEEYCETGGLSGITVPDDVQMYIAENSSSNIRELKSAVTKVIYQTSYFKRDALTLDEVKRLLEDHFSGGPSKKLSVADIQKEVEGFYKVSHTDLVGPKRSRNIIYARQISMYLCRQMLDLPFNDIGKRFNRDHSTVMYSVSNVEAKMRENREMREEIEALTQQIRNL